MQEFKLVANEMRGSKSLANAIANFFNDNFLKKLLKIMNNFTPYFHEHNPQQVGS